MILLLGGTSDMVPIANLLISEGLDVCVSTLTDDLDTSKLNKLAKSRVGELSFELLRDFVLENKVKTIIDATHPYASIIRQLAFDVTAQCKINHLRFEREATSYHGYDVLFCHSHSEAAKLARDNGKNHLLTIGSRFLNEYKENFDSCNVYARILNSERSIDEAKLTGISHSNIIAERGPFSFDDNVKTLKQYQTDVLVTKDGGKNANVIEKLEACKSLGVSVIIVLKPQLKLNLKCFSSYKSLVEKAIETEENL